MAVAALVARPLVCPTTDCLSWFSLAALSPRLPARRLAAGLLDQIESAVVEYGNAIKDLVRANIFPGDMLWKNFGVTRHGKVVFYDYDEIEYLTDCNFRKVPTPRTEEEEMSGEIWYKVGPRDVFPETFAPFLLGNPGVRNVFMKHHADLLARREAAAAG